MDTHPSPLDASLQPASRPEAIYTKWNSSSRSAARWRLLLPSGMQARRDASGADLYSSSAAFKTETGNGTSLLPRNGWI